MLTYLTGALAARTGDEMSGPALLLAGLAITGSASRAATLLAALTFSAAIGGPLIGLLLDRATRPGLFLAAALALYATALAVILTGLGHLPMPVTVAVALLAGLLGPALSGGWTSQLPRVVTPAALPRANALDAMTFDLAALTGPALAGLVADLFGAPISVAASIALICIALPAAWKLPRIHDPARVDASFTPRTDLMAGLRAITAAPSLARATAVSMVSMFGTGMLVTCTPRLGQQVLGGAGHGTVLLSAAAAGGLAANAALSRRPDLIRPDTLVGVSTLLSGAAYLVAATCRPVPLLTAAVLLGAAEGPQLTALFAIRHREAPERVRGQVFTTGASLKTTAFSLGAALAGALATFQLPIALLTAAGLQASAAILFVLLRRDRPPLPEAQAALTGHLIRRVRRPTK